MPINNTNTEAAKLTIEGRLLYLKFRQAENMQAQDKFRAARDMTPPYADACAWLAYAIQWAAREGWTPGILPDAQFIVDFANEGVSRDSTNYYMHWCLADILSGGGGKTAEALAAFDMANSLNLGNTDERCDIKVELADLKAYQGDFAEALRLIAEANAERQNPPTWYLWSEGFAHFVGKDYESAKTAIEAMETAVAAAGDNMPNPAILTWAAAKERLGELTEDEAKSVLARIRANSPRWKPEDIALMEPLEQLSDRSHWLESFKLLSSIPLNSVP